LPWSIRFEDPVALPDGRQLLTLKDAADYVTKLPKKQMAPSQVAIEALMLCSRGGDPMLARIAFMKALNRNVVLEFNPDAGKHQWGKRRGTNDRADLLDTNKQVRDPDHLKVFANADAAETWFGEKDPEGVAFEYEILE
jgi:hypothetical protein